MRHALRFAILLAITTTASLALAQDIEEIEVVEEAGEGGGQGFGGATDAPEEYIVKPGDTLWELSERFLNNPWYWPKLWSYNPQLDNPNWIRPGTRLKFYPGDIGPVVEQDDAFDDLDDDDFSDVPSFQGADAVKRFAYVGDTAARRRELFVSDEDLKDAGKIVNSPEEKTLLSLFDKVYLQNTDAKAGDVLQVFRTIDRVYHPVTGAYLGRKVELLGLARVDMVGEDERVASLTAAWGDMGRGNLVADIFNIKLESVQRQANEKEVKGYVVSSARQPLPFMGRYDVIFVDRGKDDGVEIGNSFTVVRAEDPFTGKSRGLEDLDIAEILVTDVRDKTSTGVLLKSGREVLPGDRVEMRTK
jgi:hypothetical protein